MKRIIPLLMLLSLVFITTSAVFAGNESESVNVAAVTQKITDVYMNDKVFLEHFETNEKEALELLERAIAREIELLEDSLSGTRVNPIVYCTVPVKPQVTTNWCSFATMLQTLYGMGLENQVSGTTNYDKQQTLAAPYNGTLPLVSEVTSDLNDYLSNYYYTYYPSYNLTESTFQQKVHSSLACGRPALLHAKTGSLDYYNGLNLGHYLSVDKSDTLADTMDIKDCHYNSTYGGAHTGVDLDQVYGTMTAGRYLICY